MASTGMSVQIQAAEMLTKIQELEKSTKTCIERTMKDIKKRGPTWIAKGVAQTYNIKPADITGSNLVKLNIKGGSLKELSFKYTGRRLTPTHFKMTPVEPKSGAYTIKATIIKGQRVTIGKVKKITKKQRKNITKNFHRQGTRNSPQSPIMLIKNNKSSKGENGKFIPFQRTKQPGGFDRVIKTISVPQMIKDGRGNIKPTVQRQLTDGISKRFDNHIGNILP